ncbi:MAG: ABC transporter permease [Rhodospirillaceae bacterium]
MTAVVLAALFFALGYAATAAFGAAMMPPPPEIHRRLAELAMGGDIFAEGLRTFARGLAGVLLANLIGVSLGLAAGLVRPAARLFRPVLTALNACPPVVWISFAMVWMGSGGGVPVFVVAAATLPPVFLSVAEGVRAIDPRLAAMSRLYRVPPMARLKGLIVPGVFPFWRAAFAYSAAAAWKVAAVAEFLGSADGIGARIYWAYRRLEMADLYAWTIAIVAFGIAVDAGIARLRRGRPLPHEGGAP